MHYMLLVAAEIPPEKDTVTAKTDEDSTFLNMEEPVPEDVTGGKALDTFADLVKGKDNFEILAEALADIMLAPYSQNTENPEYISLWDETDAGLKKYETGYVGFVKMPDGRVLPQGDYEFSRLYEVVDGQVYRKRFGKLHHRKRTKKARRFQIMPSRPFKELYPTFDDFMKCWWGAEYEEDTGRYGYYYNPNGMWDWYQIGGRWSFRFLTGRETHMTVHSEPNILSRDVPKKLAPDGYQWVTGARKCDIAWDVMLEFYRKEQREQFHRYEQWLQEGKIPQEYKGDYQISGDTIVSWGDVVYRKGETEEAYLLRIGLGPECHFPLNTAAILDVEGIQSIFDADMKGYSVDEKVTQAWFRRVNDFIAKQPEDALLLSVDCHM